jgi:hypothetical protein
MVVEAKAKWNSKKQGSGNVPAFLKTTGCLQQNKNMSL